MLDASGARILEMLCSHTLEDIRDPIWVCRELQRVARAGYIETPSRAEEQSWGVHGQWVGWSTIGGSSTWSTAGSASP